jgi:hypothetical protein
MGCPRPPLRFAPPPGRPHGLGRRRPFPLHRPTFLTTPLLCSFQSRKKAIFPITPSSIFFSTQSLPTLFLTVSLRAPGFLKFFTNRSLFL